MARAPAGGQRPGPGPSRRRRCGNGSVLLALFGNLPKVVTEQGEPGRRSDPNRAGVPAEFHEAFPGQRLEGPKDGPTRESLAGNRGHETVMRDRPMEYEGNCALGARERRIQVHSYKDRSPHWNLTAVP